MFHQSLHLCSWCTCWRARCFFGVCVCACVLVCVCASACACVTLCNICRDVYKFSCFDFVDRERYIIEGSLEVKLPTIWTDGKAEVGRVREEKRREEEGRSEKRKSQKKEDADGRKGRKVAKHCVFWSGGCGAIWADERWKIARQPQKANRPPTGQTYSFCSGCMIDM